MPSGEYHNVFKITNQKNGEYWYGEYRSTVPNPVDEHYGHGPDIRKQIAEHGIENFKKEMLVSVEYADRQQAYDLQAIISHQHYGTELKDISEEVKATLERIDDPLFRGWC